MRLLPAPPPTIDPFYTLWGKRPNRVPETSGPDSQNLGVPLGSKDLIAVIKLRVLSWGGVGGMIRVGPKRPRAEVPTGVSTRGTVVAGKQVSVCLVIASQRKRARFLFSSTWYPSACPSNRAADSQHTFVSREDSLTGQVCSPVATAPPQILSCLS